MIGGNAGLDLHRDRPGTLAEGVLRREEHLLDGHRFPSGLRPARLQAGEIEELVDQRRQPLRPPRPPLG